MQDFVPKLTSNYENYKIKIDYDIVRIKLLILPFSAPFHNLITACKMESWNSHVNIRTLLSYANFKLLSVPVKMKVVVYSKYQGTCRD